MTLFHSLRITAMKIIASLAFMGAAILPAAPAAAQNLAANILVEPALAGPGVARKISISLVLGCDPTLRIVSGESARKRILVVSVDVQTAIFCDGLTTRTTSISYTPEAEGELRVHVVTERRGVYVGAYVGETVIKTRAANSNRSQVDLTGMWYDPATNGSGLTFVHGFTRDDVVLGTWYVYDAQGAPRWYTIQNVQWQPGTGGLEAEGLLIETSANSVVCLPPLIGCPVAAAAAVSPARARIVMHDVNRARIEAITPNGVVAFSSNLIRAVF